MELEEVIERLEKLVKLRLNYDNCIIATEDLQIILKYIKEESISKAVVEEKIKELIKNLQNDTNRLYIEMIERKNYFEGKLQKLEDKIKAKIEELDKFEWGGISMSEIKVGEYVRTKKDGICKLLQIDEDNMWCGYVDKPFWLRKDNIVKHSPNIIDLVEEGDYVNGDRMDLVEKDENGHTYYMQNVELPSVNLKEIKSIVTKEQFQSVEYRLEG